LFRARKSKTAVISLGEMPQRAIEIHRMRSDLQREFDLSSSGGRVGLYWWYYIHGFREMWLDFRSPVDLQGPVNTAVEWLPVRGRVPVTWLMREFWRRGIVSHSAHGSSERSSRWSTAVRRIRGDAREPFSSEEQWRLVRWYFCRGLGEYNLEALLTPQQAAKLVDCGGHKKTVPLILTMVHGFTPDLHDRYPTDTCEGWREWCAVDGQDRFPILANPLLRDPLFGAASAHLPKAKFSDGTPFGVNLVGHARTRSGVGEDLRMAARSLEAAGIPFVVRNVDPSTGVVPEETGLEASLADHSPFSINIFCLAGMETVTTLSGRRNLLNGKVNIGFWPWELSEWPKLWSHAPQLMHELWASSAFTASAYRRSTSVPVRHVPMAVDVDDTEGLGRAALGLPEDRFLFGYSFDGHSSFSRKNPEGTVQAFQLAFPKGDERVRLVLKGLRTSDNPAWRRLESLAAEDPRIILISASLARGVLLDLYRAIDCFVSLHRSEGFGRNIAECMLLGKPVIATKYSGNLDFTRDDTAALVDADLRCIGDGEYPFGAGQLWASPCITQAAERMRQIFLDERWRTRIASAGQIFIKTHHSPSVAGETFKRELNRITQHTQKGNL
jgi:glycosyltransferase involved in cell wall biosynthesis